MLEVCEQTLDDAVWTLASGWNLFPLQAGFSFRSVIDYYAASILDALARSGAGFSERDRLLHSFADTNERAQYLVNGIFLSSDPSGISNALVQRLQDMVDFKFSALNNFLKNLPKEENGRLLFSILSAVFVKSFDFCRWTKIFLPEKEEDAVFLPHYVLTRVVEFLSEFDFTGLEDKLDEINLLSVVDVAEDISECYKTKMDLSNQKSSNPSAVYDKLLEKLQSEDTYIFLAAINALAELAYWKTTPFLGKLVNLFVDWRVNTGEEKKSSDKVEKDYVMRCKLGEAVAKVCRQLGDFSPIHFDSISNSLLAMIEHSIDEQTRASA
uniref:RNA polymerase II assembly factor Rtp1 C-terminal domain-containing protein n=1 Tax=Ditylenchus dipsaci TaxID=166011 RepID=A0A915DFU6_9BILA